MGADGIIRHSVNICSQYLLIIHIMITDISSESIARRHLSQTVRSQPTIRIASLVDRLQESGPAEAHRNHKPKRQLNLAISHSRRRRRHSAHSTVFSVRGSTAEPRVAATAVVADGRDVLQSYPGWIAVVVVVHGLGCDQSSENAGCQQHWQLFQALALSVSIVPQQLRPLLQPAAHLRLDRRWRRSIGRVP
jgi:hypothetical protein